MNRAILTAVGIVLLAKVAVADPIFLATNGTTLYRIENNVVEEFTLSDDITAMGVDKNGKVWATSFSDDDNDLLHELYLMANPLGLSPTLIFQGDFLTENTPTITWVGDTLYGVQKAPGALDQTSVLVTIDVNNQTQALVGATGMMGNGGAGSGYDPANDIFYMVSGGPDGELFTVDYALVNGLDPAATLVGGLGVDFVNHSAEFFEGKLYAFYQGLDDELVLGEVDVVTPDFIEILDLGPGLPSGEIRPVGLAVVPEPASLALLGTGLLLALRRRSR